MHHYLGRKLGEAPNPRVNSPEQLRETTKCSKHQAGGGGVAGLQQEQTAQVSTSAALTPRTEGPLLSAGINHLLTTQVSRASSCQEWRLLSQAPSQQGLPHKESIAIWRFGVRTAQEFL